MLRIWLLILFFFSLQILFYKLHLLYFLKFEESPFRYYFKVQKFYFKFYNVTKNITIYLEILQWGIFLEGEKNVTKSCYFSSVIAYKGMPIIIFFFAKNKWLYSTTNLITFVLFIRDRRSKNDLRNALHKRIFLIRGLITNNILLKIIS